MINIQYFNLTNIVKYIRLQKESYPTYPLSFAIIIFCLGKPGNFPRNFKKTSRELTQLSYMFFWKDKDFF